MSSGYSVSLWTAPFQRHMRFCLYNGETREQVKRAEQDPCPQEVLSRKELRLDPPPILVSNATMLEYMLVRYDDQRIELKQGEEIYVTGKLAEQGAGLKMQNPTVDKSGGELVHAGRLVPVYPQHDIINTKWLREKMALFRSSGRIFRFDNELFTEVAWLQVMQGQNLQPEAWHPLADLIADDETAAYLESVRDVIVKCVDVMPTHEAYIAEHCAAGR